MRLDAPYGRAYDQRVSCATLLLPPPDTTVSRSAELYRHLHNPGGGYSGPWRNNIAPYLVGPMDSLTDPLYGTTCFVAPAQTGKSEILLNWAAHSVVEDPADMMIVLDEKDQAEDFVERRRSKLIRYCDEVAKRLVKTTKPLAQFQGMSLAITWATGSKAASKPVPRVGMDERDSMADDLDGEGDPVELFRKRLQTFGASGHLAVISSPKRLIIRRKGVQLAPLHPHVAPPTSGILTLYNQGTRKRWYWPCPQCNDHFIPRYEDLHFDAEAWNDDDQIAVLLVCPLCGNPIHERSKPEMNEAGVWLAHGQSIDRHGRIVGAPPSPSVDSFWLQGVEAAFIGWSELVVKRLRAEKTLHDTGSDTALKTWYNTDCGRPYDPGEDADGEGLDPFALQGRAEPYPFRVVPEGVRFLTAAVDVQGTYFAVLVRGWGVNLESWVIDAFDIIQPAGAARRLDPAVYAEDWDLLVEQVIQRSYPLAARPGWFIPITTTAIDTGGAPGVTGKAYDFWRRARRNGLSEQTITLVKGDGRGQGLDVAETRADTTNAGRGGGGSPVKLFVLNVDRLKDKAYAALRREQPGPDFVHLPQAVIPPVPAGAEAPKEAAEFFQQLASERKVDGAWGKVRPRNEVWDLIVYTDAAMRRVRGHQINWKAPPPWAAPWDANSRVLRPAASAPSSAASSLAPAPTARPAAVPPPRGFALPAPTHADDPYL